MIPTTVQTSLRNRVNEIQKVLQYENWSMEDNPLFATQQGIGRVALTSSILGILFGIHFILWIYCTFYNVRHLSFSAATTKTENTIGIDNNSSSLMFALWIHQALWQWSTYACTVCLFHMMEFFITCVYNPTIASGDSFLINHSTAYTVAAITSWIEFFLRKIMTLILLSFVSSSNNNTILSIIERMYPWYWYMSLFGWILALMGQSIRSIAMMTASKNFNHYIQTRRQNNHQLVTHGIYSHLRHPSYSGFFFWSIGTQFLLGNILHTMLYTGASWKFFHDRIAYEEESLCQLFPNEYIHYIYNGNTYTGIPFIYTKQQRPPQNTTNASDEPTTREKIQ